MKIYATYKTNSKVGRANFLVLVVGLMMVIMSAMAGGGLFVEAGDKGDDIILHKGKIIMRGGKGKGNIIVDPGSHSSEESHHVMPMMHMFNPYAFYPMHQQHHHHAEPKMMRPIYIEDHSAMHQQHHHEPEHHQEQHHHHEEEQPHHQEYHHEEPQHHHEEAQHHHEELQHHHEESQQQHYEPEHRHEMNHQQHHHQQYEPQQQNYHHHEMPMYQHEHETHEGQQGEHEQPQEGYEQYHQIMSMHGSGPQPIIFPNQPQQQQQMAADQVVQQPEGIYPGQLTPEQQAALLQHHQAQAMAVAAAHLNQHQLQQQQSQQQQPEIHSLEQRPNEIQQGQGSNEVVSQVSASEGAKAPVVKPIAKVSALLQKSAAKSPLVKMIKPLFKRNKDQKESDSHKKP